MLLVVSRLRTFRAVVCRPLALAGPCLFCPLAHGVKPLLLGRFVKRPVSQCETGRIAFRYVPYCRQVWPLWPGRQAVAAGRSRLCRVFSWPLPGVAVAVAVVARHQRSTTIVTGPSRPEGSSGSSFSKNLNETTALRPCCGRGSPLASHSGTLFICRPMTGLPGAYE